MVEEGTKQPSLLGIFRHLSSRVFPFDPLPFSVFATLTGTEGEGEMTLSVTEVETDEEIRSLTRRIAFPDRFAEGRVHFRLTDCYLPRPGGYMFTLTVDGDWVAHRRLHVEQRESDA
jgi:hypothetical protein